MGRERKIISVDVKRHFGLGDVDESHLEDKLLVTPRAQTTAPFCLAEAPRMCCVVLLMGPCLREPNLGTASK